MLSDVLIKAKGDDSKKIPSSGTSKAEIGREIRQKGSREVMRLRRTRARPTPPKRLPSLDHPKIF
jgi:hypothetical protein